MQIEDQHETVEFLRDALARIDGAETIQIVETHISWVFIARTLAWKLKKAVRLPYLDFSTPARRLAMCGRELAMNRRTAPSIYLDVRKLVRDAEGALAFDGEGVLADAVLETKRFDQDFLFDRLAQRGELTPQLVARLAAIVAGFHAEAERHTSEAGTGSERVDAVLRINEAGLAAGRGLFGDEPVGAVVEATRALWQRHRPLLDARQSEGKVRLCHGDLHLRNIVAIDGEPVLFDCLEFDQDMATTDILYDLAFLLMDLWHRGLHARSNLVFNRYIDAADEVAGLPLMPLFLAMRATVRAHVSATQALAAGEAGRPAIEQDARAYLDLAASFLKPRSARLVAIGGLSGSGKSTTAAAIAFAIGAPPGARVLSSDRIRKRLFGVTPETRLPEDAYRPDISAQVYELMRQEAERVLATGHSVVADAVFDRPDDREAIEATARNLAVAFDGVWLEAPEDTLVERVEKRRGDPSDATAEVVRSQVGRDQGTMNWRRIDTRGASADMALPQ